MSKYNLLDLYPHNIDSYEKVKYQLIVDNIAAIVHATGTGKSFIALQLTLDNKNKKILYVTPYISIIEHVKEIIEKNDYLSLDKDFNNLEFRTYHSFVNMSEEEIAKLEFDILVIDEFHHIGAPIWGEKINLLIRTHKNIKILGMTAYTIRDRGTIYERDMTNSETDELFSNKVVSTYNLYDAMIDGILPKPNYKSGYVYLENTCEYLETKINKLPTNSKEYKELFPLINDIKGRLHNAVSVSDIFKTNIKTNGKYIYFCPMSAEKGRNDILTIIEEVKVWLKEMGLNENNYELYMTTSEMGIKGKENRDAFYNDEDLNHNKVDNKLRIMFAINQYGEGVHVPGLDGVIMGRTTNSDIVYYEQLGRALSIGNNNKKEYEILANKSVDELLESCDKRNLLYSKNNSKEELIDILLAPTIIDLANNISFIKELENNLKDRVKEIKINKDFNKREIHLGSATFNIDMINEDLYEILKYIQDRLDMTWDDMYELANKYYIHHKNLRIIPSFKTINGYEHDCNGYKLGTWISTQRANYKKNKLKQEQIDKLTKIGMLYGNLDNNLSWQKKYELAKIYYEHYGNLEIQEKFKTVNGYEYNDKDKNCVSLGSWIVTQRVAYEKNKMKQEKITLLEQIGMRFETNYKELGWQKKYNLAKIYYEYHKNLEMSSNFKTINGYEKSYDNGAVVLGKWIVTQRQAYVGKGSVKITPEQIKLFDSIGMKWFSEKIDKKLQTEQITEENIERKKLELTNRFYTLLNHYEEGYMPSKEELNDEFIKQLNKVKK